MDINWRKACTGNSRNIDIIYFFMKDREYKGNLSVIYCTTHLMLADYFTKPLHRALFHRSRKIIMGIVSTYTLLKYITSYSSKERIKNKIPGKHIPSKRIFHQNRQKLLKIKKEHMYVPNLNSLIRDNHRPN